MKKADMPSRILLNGERLKQAREARGLSITQLANLTGLKKQSISNYEGGKQTPKAEALEAIRDILKVSVSFLQKEIRPYSSSPIFFRALSGMAKREYNRAKIQMFWFEELFEYLNQMVNFMPPNIPRHFDISDRLYKTTMEEIEEIAGSVRTHFNLGRGPISNMTRLLENNGVVIIRMLLDVSEEDAFSQWQRDDSLPIIVSVADTPGVCRDRFSMAHELGHLILHSRVQGISPEKLGLLEKQANRFASAFLMPSQSYAKEFRFPSLDILLLLKEEWKVSIQAQICRCRDLGILTEGKTRNLYMSLARRGWRKCEPLDESLTPETPKAIKHCLELLQSELGINLDDIARETSISALDIEALCGVCHDQDVPFQTPSQARIFEFPQKR